MKEKTIIVALLLFITSLIGITEASAEELVVCGEGRFKSFMPMTALSTKSPQYKFLKEETTDEDNLRVTSDGFYAVAMGSYYGILGDKFIVTFESGKQVKVVKVDEKSDNHTSSSCYGKTMSSDGSIIEPIISFSLKRADNASNPKLIREAYFHGNIGVAYSQFAGYEKIIKIERYKESLESEKPKINEDTSFSQSDSFFKLKYGDEVEWLYTYQMSPLQNWYFSILSLQRDKN